MNKFLNLRIDNDLCPSIPNILYIATIGNPHNCVVLVTKTQEYVVRTTLSKIMDSLEEIGDYSIHHCARIGRSYIINTDNVIIPERLADRVQVEYNGKLRDIVLRPNDITQLKELCNKLHPHIKIDTNYYKLKEKMSNINMGKNIVDLGLPSGTKWFTMNIDEYGTPYPLTDDAEEYGSYIAWGEMEEKDRFTFNNHSFIWESEDNEFAFSEDSEEYDWDKSPQLPDVFDVANQKLSKNCHIPTVEEWTELIDNCEFVWCNTKLNTRGLMVTSNINGKSIFLPAGGYADENHLMGQDTCEEGHTVMYWASTLYKQACYDSNESDMAYAFMAQDKPYGTLNDKPSIVCTFAHRGLSVRAVYGGSVPSSQSRAMFWINSIRYRVLSEEKCTCRVIKVLDDVETFDIPDDVTYHNKKYKVVKVTCSMPNVKSIRLSKRITELPDFSANLERIEVDKSNPLYSTIDGVLVDKDKTTLLKYPAKYGKKYTVPKCITKIAKDSFRSASVRSVNLANVTHVGDAAFCNSTVEDVEGANVTRIDEYAFNGCNHLRSFKFTHLETIGVNAVKSTSLTYLHLPASLKELNRYTFYCSKLLKVELDARPLILHKDPFRFSPDLDSFKICGKETLKK